VSQNTTCFHYKNRSFINVYENDGCLLWESYETYKYTVWGEVKDFSPFSLFWKYVHHGAWIVSIISMVYIIKLSHQPAFLCGSLLIVARQRLGIPTNTRNRRTVGCVVFYTVRVASKESLCIPIWLPGNGPVNTLTWQRNCWRCNFLYGPCRIKGESVCLCIPIWLLGNGSVSTFPWQRRIVGGVVFYAARVISKQSRRLILTKTCCLMLKQVVHAVTTLLETVMAKLKQTLLLYKRTDWYVFYRFTF
jgi:hypothetical protein